MKINSFWLMGTTALCVLPTLSVSADLPVRGTAPALPTTAYDWTGLYAGAQVGGQQIRLTEGDTTELTNTPFGGVHAGYNKQIDSLVIGFEGEIDYVASVKAISQIGENGDEENGGDWNSGSIQGIASVRLGFAFDKALIYATGGVALIAPINGSSQASGWTLGGGLEYALSKEWSARAEYRHTDFGEFDDGQKGTIDVVTIGLSYHFPK